MTCRHILTLGTNIYRYDIIKVDTHDTFYYNAQKICTMYYGITLHDLKKMSTHPIFIEIDNDQKNVFKSTFIQV